MRYRAAAAMNTTTWEAAAGVTQAPAHGPGLVRGPACPAVMTPGTWVPELPAKRPARADVFP